MVPLSSTKQWNHSTRMKGNAMKPVTTSISASSDFSGYPSLHFTPVPDIVFDEQMADLTGAELKALMYIIRRTYGWKKDSDAISLDQMLHGITRSDGSVLDRGTGVSKPSLLAALRSLKQKGYIEAERHQTKEKGDRPTIYRLRMEGQESKETLPPRGQKTLPRGGQETLPPPWSKNLTTQDTEKQETLRQETGKILIDPVVREIIAALKPLFTEANPKFWKAETFQKAIKANPRKDPKRLVQEMFDYSKKHPEWAQGVKSPSGTFRVWLERQWDRPLPSSRSQSPGTHGYDDIQPLTDIIETGVEPWDQCKQSIAALGPTRPSEIWGDINQDMIVEQKGKHLVIYTQAADPQNALWDLTRQYIENNVPIGYTVEYVS